MGSALRLRVSFVFILLRRMVMQKWYKDDGIRGKHTECGLLIAAYQQIHCS